MHGVTLKSRAAAFACAAGALVFILSLVLGYTPGAQDDIVQIGRALIIAILCGGIMAAIFGLLISIPVLKLQGDYLAIVTLAFGQILMSVVTNLYVGVDSTGLHFSFVNNNITLDNKIILPKDTEVWEDEI